MILADTGVWVRHLRVADLQLTRWMKALQVATCDVVLSELSLGAGVPSSMQRHLQLLPSLALPSAEDTRSFINRHHRAFSAAGVGWADAQIIIAAAGAGALLYSREQPQRTVWRKLGFRLA